MFPIIPANSVAEEAGNQEGIFGYGSPTTAITNKVSNTGVVASDVAGVGTARSGIAATEYGGDKGIFGFGEPGPTAVTNLVSNAGVVASDQAAVTGTARWGPSACSYGEDKGIFGFGNNSVEGPSGFKSTTNLVSNTGVVSSDVAGVGTGRYGSSACEYGEDKGIFGFGNISSSPWTLTGVTNLVSNAGVVASDTAAVGTARQSSAACSYGEDKGIFIFGNDGSYCDITNLVSNAGVVASDVTGVGTARKSPAACEYGGDKAIFGYGATGSNVSITNLVSNAGVVASDQAATTGTARRGLAACSFN